VTHPAGSPKLAGTALTLLGGLAPWLAANPGGGALEAALGAALAAARSPDDKLSRNGATAAQRLCQCEALAAAVVGGDAGTVWAAALVALYQERGGLRQRAGAGAGAKGWVARPSRVEAEKADGAWRRALLVGSSCCRRRRPHSLDTPASSD
jgi:hypothetical protein